MTARRTAKIWLAWVGANSVGELLGLGFAFACGFLALRFFGEPATTGAVLLFAALALLLGAAEGAFVGYAQWLVLRTLLPLTKTAWILATVIGAVVAWLLGVIPGTVASLETATQVPQAPPWEPSPALELLLAAGMGAAAGIILSLAQWRVLRRHATSAIWWLPANAAAWALSMPWIFWLIGATAGGQPEAVSRILLLLGLGLAGALAGAVHGVFLVRVIIPVRRAVPPLVSHAVGVEAEGVREGLFSDTRQKARWS